MNLARILLTAAALTLQAMALSLISPGLSQAGQVYRCGGSSYQMQPCAPTQATTVVKADDARHREQLKQAASQRAQLLKADQQINRRIANRASESRNTLERLRSIYARSAPALHCRGFG